MKKTLFCLLLACTLSRFTLRAQNQANPVAIEVNLNQTTHQPLTPIWRFFGYDEADYTFMKDGKKLLTELAGLTPLPVYLRTHNLLTTGNGVPALKWSSTNAYTEDSNGNPIYSWKILDSIFDAYISRKTKPLVEVGFMPEALSVKPESDRYQTTPDGKKVYHYTGWNYPPKDYQKFAALVYQWVLHSVARYGKKEVESWYWEIWNEPDISYWKGTPEEYCKLYDYSVDAIKRALPTAKVGGPETTSPKSPKAGAFLKTFLDHVTAGTSAVNGKNGIPIDFLTFHSKGETKVIDKAVWMNIGTQLSNIDRGFEIIAGYPSLKHLPIIIGESDPESCGACSADVFPQNSYRNSALYASYTAVSVARECDLAAYRGVNLLGAVTWAFEFENQPWFRGFRELSTNGVDKPVFNVFRMFGMMRGNKVALTSNSPYNYKNICDSSVRGKQPDVNGLATFDGKSVYIMIWNYHDKDDNTVADAPVSLGLSGLNTKSVTISHYRIDQNHSNAYTVWKQMNSPQQPNEQQYLELQNAGQLQLLSPPATASVTRKQLKLSFNLPRQGVSLLVITPKN